MGVCEFYGYGYYVIDYLHEAVSWAQSMGLGEKKKEPSVLDPASNAATAAKAVTDDAKIGAASAAIAGVEAVLDQAKEEEGAANKEVKKAE